MSTPAHHANLFSLPNDVLRNHLLSHLTDVEALIFRCTCQHARELVLTTTKGKEKILENCSGKLYIYAASICSTSVLEWLYKHQQIPLHQFQVLPLSVAAFSGKNPEVVLHWLHSRDAQFDQAVACTAALHGNKELLIWICSVAGIKNYTKPIVEEAVKGGHLALVRWLIEEKDTPCDKLIRDAASSGNVELLKYIMTKPKNSLSANVMLRAAQAGSMEVIEFLRAQSPPCAWDPLVTGAAAQRGDMRMLQWLIDRGCPMNYKTTAACAKGGSARNSQVLKRATSECCGFALVC